MHKMCSDVFTKIAEALDAGKITEAQAEEKYAWAREQCEAAGAKVDDACAGPWAPPKEPFFRADPDPAAAADPAAACKAAGKEMKQKCGKAFSDIAADVAAGKITEAEAKDAYAKAAEQCKEEGAKVADACSSPWAPPKEPPSFFASLFPAPETPGKKDPACKDAVAEVKAKCKDPFPKIAADLAAGKITPAEAEKELAEAAEGCKEAGAAMAEACKPKPAGPPEHPPVFGWGGHGVAPAVPVDLEATELEFNKCAHEIAHVKETCTDAYKKIDAEVKAKKITPKEASKEFAQIAAKCKKEYSKIGATCKPK